VPAHTVVPHVGGRTLGWSCNPRSLSVGSYLREA